MMRKKSQLIAAIALVAVSMIVLGLFLVVRVYDRYRSDMLVYESRHMDSIVSTSARGLDWMMDGYIVQLQQLVGQREVLRAEEEYLDGGGELTLRALMAKSRMRKPFPLPSNIAVFDQREGRLLASAFADFPQSRGDDEVLGDSVVLRSDEEGTFWFVFGAESANGLWYEAAVRALTMFSSHSDVTHVGRHGYLFLLDRERRFLAWGGEGETGVGSVEDVIREHPDISGEALSELAVREPTFPEDYAVYRFPWEAYPDGSEETLVVTSPLFGSGSGLVMGAAVSFQEFNAFLSNTLQDVAGVILLELGGALILFIVAARILIANRRSAMELAALRERANLMEEINRQQQSLAHGERLQQLGVMTSGIVHEFNNLLTPIMGQSHLLLEQLADNESSPQFESALDIYEASENARDSLRKISAMGKKDVDMGFRVLDLGALLKKTMNLSSMAKDPHITQEIVLPSEPICVSGNDQLLTQAFLNICINGCQAMGAEGALTITAAVEQRSGQRYARVEISDTGPGIPEETFSSIYDPYYTTKGERGTGLGLAICQKIIETHKGTISAANRETGGAVFTVRIPMVDLPEED